MNLDFLPANVESTTDKGSEANLQISEKNFDFNRYRIVIIGLGYVGLTLAAHLLKKGFLVLGIEKNPRIIEILNKGEVHVHEIGLSEIIKFGIENKTFIFTDQLINEESKSSIFIITVGTPINNKKELMVDSIINATKEVTAVVNHGDIVILRSTVKVGTTEEIVKPILDESKKDVGLAFCPERTLEGKALVELATLPQIVGANDSLTRKRVTQFFYSLTNLVVETSNIKTAEMIKLVDNMQRDTSFAISNHVAQICNSLSIRASEVVNLGKIDYARTNLPNPGPVGGPCLGKDSYILRESIPFENINLSMTARKTNEFVIEQALDFMESIRISNKMIFHKVCVLGLAFKGQPETNDMRGSPSLDLISKLKLRYLEAKIVAWDPLIKEVENNEFSLMCDLDKATSESNLIILMNNHPKISSMSLNQIISQAKNPLIVYDFWDRYENNGEKIKNKNFIYYAWGKHFT